MAGAGRKGREKAEEASIVGDGDSTDADTSGAQLPEVGIGVGREDLWNWSLILFLNS